MEIDYGPEKIVFEKELSPLDEFTIAFTEVLETQGAHYALMSGYVAILFGRSRESEDIDMFVEKMAYEKFLAVWKGLSEQFECITTSKPEEAYHDYLSDNIAIRFAIKGNYIPNMEIKFPKRELDFDALQRRVKVVLNGCTLYISPLETQIAFKLFLGSDKDIEDARHLVNVFKEHLNRKELMYCVRKLQVQEEYNKYLYERLN